MPFPRTLALVSLAVLTSACAAQPAPAPSAADTAARAAETNKALVRSLVADFDGDALAAADKWLTADFTTVMNGEAPMNRDAYKQMIASVTKSFSNIRHEIHDIVAEADRVVISMTLHLTHTGEYEGIKPTGRTIKIAEMAVMQLRDGKLASERVMVDFDALNKQLTAK